jgi:hypothetical protein
MIYKRKADGTRVFVDGGFDDYETAALHAADIYKQRENSEIIELEEDEHGALLPFLSLYDIAERENINTDVENLPRKIEFLDKGKYNRTYFK